jgi:5'-methylthioadenosine phosphorylase
MTDRGGVAVILGSAFDLRIPERLGMERRSLDTPFGPQEFFEGRTEGGERAIVIHRHGFPHRLLPHRVNFRAQIWALRARGCGALVLNSSVGVLDAEVPTLVPLLATDLLMPENRLPDGSLCTLFTEEALAADPSLAAAEGHLVLTDGIFSRPLGDALRRLDAELRGPAATLHRGPDPLVFVYAPGPRTKTPAENRFWAALGGQVNSMSVGPEAVLAAEVRIPCAALVVGHKRSRGTEPPPGREALARSLEEARAATEELLLAFLREGSPVEAGNLVYRFGGGEHGGKERTAAEPAGPAMPPTGEEVTVLVEAPGFRVERIVSRGHTTPEGHWYDQEALEWVTLLSGAARLRLLDPDEAVSLAPGDTLLIPPHRRHRVEWTDPDGETVWVAVFHEPGRHG